MLVEVTDSHGCLVPESTLKVVFQIDGAGELAGVGNGNPDNVDSFRQPSRSESARTEGSRSSAPYRRRASGAPTPGSPTLVRRTFPAWCRRSVSESPRNCP
ncbi:hypothetical protein [Streptomyces mirabilis]|uniref:hypothetical protein n=1 Tax=Streptomyces mirabilis TaxID=68239 RepID=UPI0036DC98E8